MSIEEYTKLFYPTKAEMEQIALENFIGISAQSVTGDQKAITNALLRGGINNISDLHKASIDQVKSIRCLGSKRLDIVLELKKTLDSIEGS